MEDKEAMANLTSIKLTLSQSLTQAQETIMMISNRLQALHNQKKSTTKDIPVMENKAKETKYKWYCWTHGRTRRIEHTSATCIYPKNRTPIRSNLLEHDGSKLEVVQGGQVPWIEWRSEKHYSGEN